MMMVTVERIGNKLRVKIMNIGSKGNIFSKNYVIDDFYYINQYDLLILFEEGQIWTDFLVIE